MVKLIRAMASLLATIADVAGACDFALSQCEFAPPEAKRLGSQTLVSGCILLEVKTSTRMSHETHFIGYWDNRM